MSKKVLVLTAVVLAFAASGLQAGQISCSWLGCDDGLWGDPSNWSCGMVPDNNETDTFVVTIDTSSCANELQIGLEQNRTIDQLDCYGEVQLEKWTSGWWWVELTIYNGLTNHGELDIGELNIRGNITNTTGATLGLYDDKSIRGGNVCNQAGAMIEVADKVIVFEDGNIDNAGVIRIVPSSSLETKHTLRNAGQINIYDGACGGHEIFDNNSTGIISGFGVLYGGNDFFRNKGQIIAFGGSLLVGSFGPIINSGLLANKAAGSLSIGYAAAQAEDVNNSGTIEVNAGGGVAFDCNLVNVTDANIHLLGGTLAAKNITQSAGATFEGFGGITGDVIIEPNSITEPNSIIKLTGPTNLVGDVTIDPNATLEISDGQTLITGHTICKGTIRLIGGTVIFQGGCDCDDCNIIWEPGTYTNVADFNLDGTVNFKDYADFANTWLWKASWY